MADELSSYAQWLCGVATAAGYDPDQRGSIARLARDAGIDHGQVSRFLTGQAKPKAATMVKLAKALGVRVEEMARRAGGDEFSGSVRTVTREEALLALGLTEPAERKVILALIDLLKAHRAE